MVSALVTLAVLNSTKILAPGVIVLLSGRMNIFLRVEDRSLTNFVRIIINLN